MSFQEATYGTFEGSNVEVCYFTPNSTEYSTPNSTEYSTPRERMIVPGECPPAPKKQKIDRPPITVRPLRLIDVLQNCSLNFN